MPDKTASSRVRRQRDLRVREGWQEVKVWVPTPEDAEDIRNLAAERRAKAEALEGLSREVNIVDQDREIRIAKAIAELGSSAYTVPTGAVLTLMTDLSNEDDLVGFARAYVILARAKPAHAASVENAVPAKITNFLIKHRQVNPSTLMHWTANNPGWQDTLRRAVREPKAFERAVEHMAVEINASVKH